MKKPTLWFAGLLALVLLQPVTTADAQVYKNEPNSGLSFNIDIGSIVRLIANQKKDVVDENYETGQVQVLWESMSQASAGMQDIEEYSSIKPIAVENLSNLGVVIALYQLPTHREAISVRDELRERHPDWTIDLNGIQTPQGPRLYALTQMGFSQSAAPSSVLKKIRLGVVDGPFNNDVQLRTTGEAQHSVLPNEDQPASPQHGNAIAALIAGAPLSNGFAGSAPNVNLSWAVATRQINGRESTNSFLMSKALDWLIGQRVSMINISMGGSGDAVLSTVFKQVERRSVVVLAAAGNGGASAAPAFPAAYPSVLAVTAVDSAERIYRQANQGAYIDFSASGVDVWTPTAGYVSGTSFASAMAAGALARLGGATSKASAIAKLCRNAKDLGDMGNDDVYGCGLLQVN